MSSREAAVGIEELLAHREWVRRLAVTLTRDGADADDVEQETWLAALRRPPRHAASPRGWLGTVLRNVVRERGRSGARRVQREAAVARPESATWEDPAELTARAELHARVAAAVIALDEPYRRAILLRHFEDLPVADVARRMGTPLETARARLRRGRARLRARLERDIGGGRPLALVLLPLTRGGSTRATATATTTTVAIGGAVMTGKAVAAVVVGVVILAAVFLWPPGDDAGTALDGETAAERGTPDGSAAGEPGAGGETAGTAGRTREHVGTAAGEGSGAPGNVESAGDGAATTTASTDGAEPEEPAEPGKPEPTIAERMSRSVGRMEMHDTSMEEVIGRIAWITGAPIEVDIRVVGDVRDKRTSLNIVGAEAREAMRYVLMIASLEMREEEDRVVLHRAGDEWREGARTVRIEPVPPPEEREPVMLRGRVVDADGRGIAGATIHGFREPLRADADGSFEVEVPPRRYGLTAWADGHLPAPYTAVEPPFPAEVLVRIGPPAAIVDVRILDTDGAPLPSAVVRARYAGGGADLVTTDAEGRGRLGRLQPGAVTLTAVARHHGLESRVLDVAAGEPTNIEVRLPKRTIAERLQHERTSFVIDRQPLSSAVLSLYGRWDLHVRASGELPQDIADRIVDVRVDHDTLEGALRTICTAAGCTFRVDEGREMVWIETE